MYRSAALIYGIGRQHASSGLALHLLYGLVQADPATAIPAASGDEVMLPFRERDLWCITSSPDAAAIAVAGSV